MRTDTNEQKLRKIYGIDRDENGRVWLDVIMDVWLGTFGREARAEREGN